MRIERLRFPGSRGFQLAARLDLPDTEPVAYALFAHCFTCTKNLKSISHISRGLSDAGIAMLRFDFTGLGESEGEFSDTNFSSNVGDLLAAARFLKANYAAPQIVIGHSMGGPAVMQAVRQIPSAVAVVSIGAPADLEHLSRTLMSKRAEIERVGEAEVTIGGRKFTLKQQLFDDLGQNHMAYLVANLGRPLLILHSPQDETVAMADAYRIFEMARQPKSLISLDGADHLLLVESDAQYVGSLIAAWADRYLVALGR